MPSVRRHLRCILALLTAAAPALSADDGRAQSPRCEARVADRWTLSFDDGTHVYVEPRDWVTSGTRTLLAGTPTWLLADSVVGTGAGGVSGTLTGVMLDADRTVTPVPWPVADRPLYVMRVAARPGGGWRVILAEMTKPFLPNDRGDVVGLWYGEWDGSAWAAVEPVPLPRSGFELQLESSSIVPWHDGFVWAVPWRDDPARGAAILFNEAGAWRWETIEARLSTYVELATTGGVLYAGFVHPDPAESYDRNSLFLYRRDDAWTPVRRLVRGGTAGVYHPRDVGVPGRAVWTWMTNEQPIWQTRALVDVFAAEPVVLPIDDWMAYHDWFADPSGAALWVTEHVMPDRSMNLRIARLRADELELLAEIPSPFTGFSAARSAGPYRIEVVGPLFSEDPDEATLVSLVLAIELDCPDE